MSAKAKYTLHILAESGYESTTEGECTPAQYGAAMAALHGSVATTTPQAPRKTKHTPGPWRLLPAEDDKLYLRIRGTQLGCRYKVANVHRTEPTSNLELDARDGEETRANATLMVTAPELLEELELAAEFIESMGMDAGPAREVINKAKGVTL